MELSIIIPSIRKGWFQQFMRSVHMNTKDVDFEVLDNHEVGNLYKIVNQEFRKARGKYVVLICDDCVVRPKWARNMIDMLDAQEGTVEGNFIIFESRKDILRGPLSVKYFGKECSIIPFVRRSDILGDFMDERFNRFYGDIDLSLRFLQVGGKIMTCPQSEIVMYQNRDAIKKDAVANVFPLDDSEFIKKWGKY